jgi:hypothetical protein
VDHLHPPSPRDSSPSSSSSSGNLPTTSTRPYTSDRLRKPAPLRSNIGSTSRQRRGPRQSSPGSASEKWADIRQWHAIETAESKATSTESSCSSSTSSNNGVHPSNDRYGKENRELSVLRADGDSPTKKKKGWLAPASDDWLERDCKPGHSGDSSDDEVGFMRRPAVVALTQTFWRPLFS